MTFYPLIVLGGISLIVLLWYEGMRSREFVISVCRRKCKEYELQLLDQTVSLSRFTFRRNSAWGLSVHREYRFEVSSNGSDRLKGYVEMQGRYLISLQIENPEGTTIIYPEQAITLE
jgi:hypothetical protein